MKTLLLCYASPTRILPSPPAVLFRLSLWAMVLAATCSLLSAAEVHTLAGGPSEVSPNPAGYVDGVTATAAQFNTPYGIALDPTGTTLFVADRDNNAIRQLDLPAGETFTFATDRIDKPVGVAVDGAGTVYVLNRGNGNNGTVLTFDSVPLGGNFRATNAANLVNAAGIALDTLTNIYITVQGNTVKRITPDGVIATVLTIADAGTSLQGLTLKRDGYLAVCDSGRHGIYIIDPNTGGISNRFGFHGAGDFTSANNVASSSTAQFNQPYGVAAAGDGTLVVTDNGNHRVKAVLNNGVVTNLYGVNSSFWVQGSASDGIFPGWWDGTVTVPDVVGTVEARSPVGVVFAPDGSVYTTETYYHLIRQVTDTGLPLPPPPPQPVPAPRIGWVDFTVPPSIVISVLRTGPDGTTFTFNNDQIIAVEGVAGTETHFTVGATPSGVDTVPNPTPFNGSTPPVYHDGLFPNQVPPSIVSPQPDVTVKAIDFQIGRPSSAVIQARFIFKTGSPIILGDNAAQFTVSSETLGAEMWYTTDGSDPISAPPSVGPITGPIDAPASISLNISSNTTFRIRAFRNNYQPSEIAGKVFSTTNFNANKITFGFVSGEASSEFIASPGQLFYAPVTLSIVPGTLMYSLQFNVTVTNLNSAPPVTPGAVDFVSTLVKPNPLEQGTFIRVPPAMFLGVTTNFVIVTNTFGTNIFLSTNVITVPANFDPPPTNQIIYPFDDFGPFLDLRFVNTSENLIGVGWLERFGKKNLYDTTTQDLIKFSLPHDTLFDEGGGKVVLGGYAFRVPGTAAPGQQYRIQLGRPSATLDGVGRPGSDVYIETPTRGSLTNGALNSIKYVTAGQLKYVVGDAAPFRWFNAGDFGNTNLLSSDVVQVFQSAIYSLNYPPPGSDFFDVMDSCCGTAVNGPGYLILGATITNTATLNGLFNGDDTTINAIAFGDGRLDVTDIYVTFRRSLDPALLWFQRFWTNGVRGAQTYPNVFPTPPAPAALTVAVAPDIIFSAGDAIVASGQTILIPINARIRGDYPLRVMALGLTVQPLDGSPAITTPVQFLNSALGAPTISDSRGPGNFAATWLNSAVTGLSGDVQLGTLQITVPANCPINAAYAVHFDHASGSPNGIVPFPGRVKTGLITRSNRSASSLNDGIPDEWRLRYFGTLNNLLSQADADADGDGATTLQEYKAGTDPNDRTSVLQASASKTTGNEPFTIRWPSVEGIRYEVERSATLFGDSWVPIANKVGTGLELQFQDGDSFGKIQYFYRVRVSE
jgi:sugar lactone lactonase YvrE